MGSELRKDFMAGHEDPEIVGVNNEIQKFLFDRNEMRRLGKTKIITKDPRFINTLPYWIAAGAYIEGVFLCVRDMDEVVKSSEKSCLGGLGFLHKEYLHDRLNCDDDYEFKKQYGINLEKQFIAYCHEIDLPLYVIRFPESTRTFSEIRELNRVVPEENLRQAWEATRVKR